MLSHPVCILALATLATSLGPIGRRDAASIPQDTFAQITPSTNLSWQPCLSTFFCAVLDVSATPLELYRYNQNCKPVHMESGITFSSWNL